MGPMSEAPKGEPSISCSPRSIGAVGDALGECLRLHGLSPGEWLFFCGGEGLLRFALLFDGLRPPNEEQLIERSARAE